MKKYEVIKTADGSKTLYLPDINEQYHSLNGAVTESNFVYLQNGYLHQHSDSPIVLEIGFGTGLNCLLTALKAEEMKRPTLYYSVEKYPLEQSLVDKLNYGKMISQYAQLLFREIQNCKWELPVQISEYFHLCKLNLDLTVSDLNTIRNCSVIYFDAFGPDKQPEMWSPEIFSTIYNKTLNEGIFVTYSAKGQVRRELAAAGFTMERLPGPPGKKEMLRGIKLLSKI